MNDAWLCFLTISWFLFPEPFLPQGKGRSHLWKREDVMKGDGLQGRKRRAKPAFFLRPLERRVEPKVRDWVIGWICFYLWPGMRLHAGVGVEESAWLPGSIPPD